MNLFSRIQAGALQFVLFLGTIIALLLMAFTLLSYTYSFFSKNSRIVVDLVQSADLSLDGALRKNLNSDNYIDLAQAPVTTSVSKDYWGLFEKYTVVASHQTKRFTKIALVGSAVQGSPPALYLQDKQRPLIVAGSAKINGDAYLPQQGIRLGHVGGSSYYRDQLLYGVQRRSTTELPSLSEGLIRQLQLLAEYRPGMLDKTIEFAKNTTYKNSFQQSTQVVQGDFLVLDEVQLTGNIIIRAWEKIVVEPTVMLNDVLLVAPEIEIMDGVVGSFQAIATERIDVGSAVRLNYPSALALLDKSGFASWEQMQISVGSDSDIRGMIMFLGDEKKSSYQPQIHIAENTSILGEVYCSHNLELKGQVFGKVTTASFIAMENGSIYQNHLYNGQIDALLLPEEYAGILHQDSAEKKSVAKWLY